MGPVGEQESGTWKCISELIGQRHQIGRPSAHTVQQNKELIDHLGFGQQLDTPKNLFSHLFSPMKKYYISASMPVNLNLLAVERLLWIASSTGRCNTRVKSFCRCFE